MLGGPASMDWQWIFFNNRDKSSIGFFFFWAKKKGTVLGGGNSHVFHPELWGNDPILTFAYVSIGLKPPSRKVQNCGVSPTFYILRPYKLGMRMMSLLAFWHGRQGSLWHVPSPRCVVTMERGNITHIHKKNGNNKNMHLLISKKKGPTKTWVKILGSSWDHLRVS